MALLTRPSCCCSAALASSTHPNITALLLRALASPGVYMPAPRRCRVLASHLDSRRLPTPSSSAAQQQRGDDRDAAAANQIAIVDLSSPAGDAAIAAELSEAFERTGFAVVVGAAASTISASSGLEAAARDFFRQPPAAKFSVRVDEAYMEAPDGYPGYLEPGHSSVANLLGDFSRPPDAVELLTYKDLHFYEAAAAATAGGAAAAAVGGGAEGGTVEKPAEFAPAVGEIGGYPSEAFRQSALSHFRGVHALWLRLCGLAELALELSPGYFEDYFGGAMGTSLQIRNYPRPDTPDAALEPGQMGFGAHNDSGFLTIVHTQTPGLQVDPSGNGQWVSVPVVPGGYVVNVGRLLARWTNDRWLSAIHRVVPPSLNPEQPTKITCAFFSAPAPDAMIECLPSCLLLNDDSTDDGGGGAGGGAKYPPINAGDFQRERSELHAPGAKASGAHLTEDPRLKQQQQQAGKA